MKQIGILLLPAVFALSAFGAACPNGGTLQQYINLSVSDGGCDAGPGFIISNWAYASVSVFANPITANDILVSYTFDGSGVPQLNFASNWLADVNLLTSNGVGVLAFSLEARSQNFNFTGVDLIATGSVSPMALNIANVLVPTAAASVTEVNCIGGLVDLRDSNNVLNLLTLPANLGDIACNGGGVEAGATAALGSGTNVTANALINLGPGDNFIDTIKIITVSDLLNVPLLGIDGRAQITSISQNFAGAEAAVPEPGAILLTALGLTGLGLTQRRRLSRSREN